MISLSNILKSIFGLSAKNKEAHKTAQEAVYQTIKSFGKAGCISDDVLRLNPSMLYPSITARYSKMIRDNLIEVTGEHRPGNSGCSQRVMRAKV